MERFKVIVVLWKCYLKFIFLYLFLDFVFRRFLKIIFIFDICLFDIRIISIFYYKLLFSVDIVIDLLNSWVSNFKNY